MSRSVATTTSAPGWQESAIYAMDVARRRVTTLISSFEGWSAWSPDGRTMAYAGSRGNAGAVRSF